MFASSKYYTEDIKSIDSIDFTVFSNDDVKNYSAVKAEPFGISVPFSYDGYEPKKNGLVDLRMGTCDIYLNCLTCGLNSNDCPGHFGHTELADNVYHYGFLDHVVYCLKSTCRKCSKLLIEKTPEVLNKYNNKNNKERFKETKELTKNVKYCYNCGTPVPKIKKEVNKQSASIKISFELAIEKSGDSGDELSRSVKEYITPRECYNILRNISDNDCYLLGFDIEKYRPHDLILQRIPIAPVTIRPSAKVNFTQSATREDTLTIKIANIINSNSRVRNELNKDNGKVEDLHNLLQYNIATYFDNSSSLPQSEVKGGAPLKSISERIKGKNGRVRNNIMGKRVDFSGRSVITGDPNIDIDQLGVPLAIAKTLTIPEEVTPQNIKHLTRLVKNGTTTYPGANYVFKTVYINGKPINQRIDLSFRKGNVKLNYGDIVERQIVDGDYVLFNRQPTLHKPSMMGHRIHVLKRDDSNSFRMNASVCGPYNADFDKSLSKTGDVKSVLSPS